MEDRIRIRSEEVLSDDWAVLKKTVLDYRRRDGQWETQIRQTYDRGDGAVILPFDPERQTVLLVRQFRLPAFVSFVDVEFDRPSIRRPGDPFLRSLQRNVAYGDVDRTGCAEIQKV